VIAHSSRHGMKMPSPQLDLFPPPTPPRRDDPWDVGFSEPVKLELLAAAAAKPERWLGWSDFDQVREKYKIGCCMGHVLSSLVRDGRLRELRVWFGAEFPGQETEYKGYGSRWRALA
jgi:hypothetical protein